MIGDHRKSRDRKRRGQPAARIGRDVRVRRCSPLSLVSARQHASDWMLSKAYQVADVRSLARRRSRRPEEGKKMSGPKRFLLILCDAQRFRSREAPSPGRTLGVSAVCWRHSACAVTTAGDSACRHRCLQVGQAVASVLLWKGFCFPTNEQLLPSIDAQGQCLGPAENKGSASSEAVRKRALQVVEPTSSMSPQRSERYGEARVR